jgi:hypothetical protein
LSISPHKLPTLLPDLIKLPFSFQNSHSVSQTR